MKGRRRDVIEIFIVATGWGGGGSGRSAPARAAASSPGAAFDEFDEFDDGFAPGLLLYIFTSLLSSSLLSSFRSSSCDSRAEEERSSFKYDEVDG